MRLRMNTSGHCRHRTRSAAVSKLTRKSRRSCDLDFGIG